MISMPLAGQSGAFRETGDPGSTCRKRRREPVARPCVAARHQTPTPTQEGRAVMFANERHAILLYLPSACAHTAVAGASRGS